MEIEPIYKKLDEYLEYFTRNVSVIKAVKPVNVVEERKKFESSGGSYNPQFVYKPLKVNLKKLRRQTEVLLEYVPESEMGDLYRDRLRENLVVLDLIESVGQDARRFTDLSIQLYGKPEEKYLKMAAGELEKLQQAELVDEGRMLNAEEIAEQMRAEIERLGLSNKVLVIDNPRMRKNQISIGKFSGTIKIAANTLRSENDVEGVIAHEIGVHALRSHNGSLQPYGIYRWGTAGYIKTEEGLAMLKQYEIRRNKVKWKSAGEYLLIDFALRHDFVETFKRAVEIYADEDRAWSYTIRVKRGIADTEQPGAFTKDQYFGWAHDCENLDSAKLISNGKIAQ